MKFRYSSHIKIIIIVVALILQACSNESKIDNKESKPPTVADTIKGDSWWSKLNVFQSRDSVKNITLKDTLLEEKDSWWDQLFTGDIEETDSITEPKETVVENLKDTVTVISNQSFDYPDYLTVKQWMQSNPPQFAHIAGEKKLFKVLKIVTIENKTKTHHSFVKNDDIMNYPYLLVTDDEFFILKIGVYGSECVLEESRRISQGWMKEALYELEYNDDGTYSREVYKAQVNPFIKDDEGELVFGYKGKFDQLDVENLFIIGPSEKINNSSSRDEFWFGSSLAITLWIILGVFVSLFIVKIIFSEKK